MDVALIFQAMWYVLRSWIAHGDVASVWMTLPFATVLAKPHVSTVAHLLEACQQAGVSGCFAGLSNNMTCQALVKCANRNSAIKQLPVDM